VSVQVYHPCSVSMFHVRVLCPRSLSGSSELNRLWAPHYPCENHYPRYPCTPLRLLHSLSFSRNTSLYHVKNRLQPSQDDNYYTWKEEMGNIFLLHGSYDIVTGTLPKTAATKAAATAEALDKEAHPLIFFTVNPPRDAKVQFSSLRFKVQVVLNLNWTHRKLKIKQK
jgi:hypothetical protein